MEKMNKEEMKCIIAGNGQAEDKVIIFNMIEDAQVKIFEDQQKTSIKTQSKAFQKWDEVVKS